MTRDSRDIAFKREIVSGPKQAAAYMALGSMLIAPGGAPTSTETSTTVLAGPTSAVSLVEFGTPRGKPYVDLLEYADFSSPVDIETTDDLTSATDDPGQGDLEGGRSEEAGYVQAFANNLEKLETFKELGRNWDGYGAGPLSDEVVERASELISQPGLTRFQPDVFPTGRGSVQLEYHNAAGGYLEIEVYSDSYGMYVEDEGREDEEDNLTWTEVTEMIRSFNAPRPN